MKGELPEDTLVAIQVTVLTPEGARTDRVCNVVTSVKELLVDQQVTRTAVSYLRDFT